MTAVEVKGRRGTQSDVPPRTVAGPPPDDDTIVFSGQLPGKQRADGTTLVCVYCGILFILPSHLIVAAIPLALAPSMLFGMVLGLLWFCAQMVNTVGMAKGRSLVRTSLFLFALSQLATYGFATYGWLPGDEMKATDRSVLTIMAVVVVGIMVCDSVRGLGRVMSLATQPGTLASAPWSRAR